MYTQAGWHKRSCIMHAFRLPLTHSTTIARCSGIMHIIRHHQVLQHMNYNSTYIPLAHGQPTICSTAHTQYIRCAVHVSMPTAIYTQAIQKPLFATQGQCFTSIHSVCMISTRHLYNGADLLRWERWECG